MEHTMTWYVAERWTNEFMRSVDLRPDYKWYVVEKKVTITVKEGVIIDKKFLMNMIEKSATAFFGHEKTDYWIPAISFPQTKTKTSKGLTTVSTTHTLHVHKTVKELSNGQRIMFVN